MDDAAKLELDQQVTLYQFYIGSYLKAAAFYLAASAALLKFAFDEEAYRQAIAVAGLVCTMASIFPLRWGFRYVREQADAFSRLGKATNTTPVSTRPFRMLLQTIALLLSIGLAGWLFLIY